MMRMIVVLPLIALGCASPSASTSCPSGRCSGGNGVDMASGVDAAPPAVDLAMSAPDMAQPLGTFGQPCDDNAQCDSGICINAGSTGGFCTRLCDPPECPAGFGCYGVLGAIEDGIISFVCVSNRAELCTPCSANTECSSTGKDQCIPFATGGSFCGGDCSKVSCPSGYKCNDVPAGDGGTSKQCVPTSGACDCNKNLAGDTKACQLTTPFGTCQGTLTCQGAAGWGSCAPPSTTDVPDGTYKDDNCDGIDGDITKGIFVSTANGLDIAGCGATYQYPCKTIAVGIARATSAPTRPYVYVQAGVYNEEVSFTAAASNVTIVGGYDANWQRADRGAAGHNVRINGAGFDSGEGQYLTVKARNAKAVGLMDLDVYGIDADSAAHPGLSSYTVHAIASDVTLTRVGVFAGRGAAGLNGMAGANADNLLGTAGMNAPWPGATGGAQAAVESSDFCNNTSRQQGGWGGSNSCGAGRNPVGGAGGLGGTKDTSCNCSVITPWNCNFNATDGNSGWYAAQWLSDSAGNCIAGCGGPAGKANASGATGDGWPGGVLNGLGGATNGNVNGLLAGNWWVAYPGGTGGRGDHGTGGGAGGGAGGNDSGTDSTGGGGGGAGAGGCAAKSGGAGGGGGGGSFAILALNGSTISVISGTIFMGVGGNGGSGGQGATGQNGGAGAPGGGNGGSESQPGGHGGDGAHGGHAGGGAGGNGGNSYGIYSVSSTVNQSTNFSGGYGGTHGTAGAPAIDASGNGYASGAQAGASGLDGQVRALCAYPGGNC